MISILICTWNRGSLIHETLQSIIENSDYKADEIIIVNGGGEKDCSTTLKYWKDRCPYLREIKTKNINLANSRNVGLQEVKGEIVLMTDDDARVFPDWIRRMKETHERYPEAGVIGGEVVDASGSSFLNHIADVTTFPRYEEVKVVRHVPGVNCSFKRAVIEQIGKQDISLFRGEDVDYTWRAQRKGWKVLYDPAIKVYHVHRPTWRGLFHQHHMYGRAYYRVRKKWQDMYCAYPRNLNTPRMWAKGLYYLVSPWFYSSQKTKVLTKLWERILGYFVITAISYYTMYGTFKQWIYDFIYTGSSETSVE